MAGRLSKTKIYETEPIVWLKGRLSGLFYEVSLVKLRLINGSEISLAGVGLA